MEYEIGLKNIIAVLLGSGGLFWTIQKVYNSYVNRNKYRELTVKKGKSGDYDINAKGLTIPEIMALVKQLNVNEPEKPSLKLVKPTREQSKD